jgi:hypothetical protein
MRDGDGAERFILAWFLLSAVLYAINWVAFGVSPAESATLGITGLLQLIGVT